MNWCWLTLKFVQFSLSALIGMLFALPQNLAVNEEAMAEGKTEPMVRARITTKSLICSKPNYDFEMADENFTNVKRGVRFPSTVISCVGADTKNKFVSLISADNQMPFEVVRNTLGCLQHYQGDKQECMCWNWPLGSTVLAVTVISLIGSALSLCDMVSICATEREDAQTKCMQGLGSCICSLITGLAWMIQGFTVWYYAFYQWPYIYVETDLPEDEIPDNQRRYNFYKIPKTWMWGVGLSFSFFIIMCIEGAVYVGESGFKILQIANRSRRRSTSS